MMILGRSIQLNMRECVLEQEAASTFVSGLHDVTCGAQFDAELARVGSGVSWELPGFTPLHASITHIRPKQFMDIH